MINVTCPICAFDADLPERPHGGARWYLSDDRPITVFCPNCDAPLEISIDVRRPTDAELASVRSYEPEPVVEEPLHPWKD